MKLCPYCAEEIQDAAIVCRYCGRDLEPAAIPPYPRPDTKPTKPIKPVTKTSAAATFILFIFVLLFLICIGVFYLPGTNNSSSPARSEPSTVRLVCQECADEGIAINLWDSPKRTKVVGFVPHMTTVVYLDQETYNGRLFYRVSHNGVRGWLPEEFVRK